MARVARIVGQLAVVHVQFQRPIADIAGVDCEQILLAAAWTIQHHGTQLLGDKLARDGRLPLDDVSDVVSQLDAVLSHYRCDYVAAIGGTHQADLVQDGRWHHIVNGPAQRVGQFAGSVADDVPQGGDAVRAAVVGGAVAAATQIGAAGEEEEDADHVFGQA